MKKYFLLASVLLLVSLFAFLTFPVLAQTGPGSGGDSKTTFENPLGEGNDKIEDIITNVINWLLGISMLVALFSFIWGGFYYIASLGDEGRIATAKKILNWSVIGLVIIFLSFIIIQTIQTLLTGTTAAGT